MASAVPSQPPISFSRTGSAGTAVESVQLDQSSMRQFGIRQPSFAAAPPVAAMHQPARVMFSTLPQPQPPDTVVVRHSPYSSFGDANSHVQLQPTAVPQIYTAAYSGVSVYEMEVNRITVMRRRQDSWLNATQVLKVAGVEKGKRTKVLEKEILTGQHEKIQGGYGKYQGTWVPYARGREFCRQYGVEDTLRPLLEYDMGADGTSIPGQSNDTPTKEQAMAASRKQFYNSGVHARASGSNSNGTFFQNISPTASNALAAISKASRFDSTTSRPASAQKGPDNLVRRGSYQHLSSQEGLRSGSGQQSTHSVPPEGSSNARSHTEPGNPGRNGSSDERLGGGADASEPPRKRLRPSSRQDSYPGVLSGADVSLREGTPTEPNDSFYYSSNHQVATDDEVAAMAMPPLPTPKNTSGEEKLALLLDMLGDRSNTDYSNHSAILHLSGQDLDLPLDQSANTALHWAATLARVPLMKLLISKGANIARGNIAGETPLMAAVGVNNSLDHSCFPDMLEILAPLIEVRDARGRTILHHIAVSCGIKGRSASSKYYLEALLEFIVRRGGPPNMLRKLSDHSQSDLENRRPIGIARFMSHMVNARDRAGNTALNLVARIGNRSIIHQLLEVGADATVPNHKGLRPVDFGVGSETELASHQPFSHPASLEKNHKTSASRIEETSRDIISAMTSLLTQSSSQFSTSMRTKQQIIDTTNASLRDYAATAKDEMCAFERLQQRAKERSDRRQRVQNLRRAVAEQKSLLSRKGVNADVAKSIVVGDADSVVMGGTVVTSLREGNLPSPHQLTSPLTPAENALLSTLPSSGLLRVFVQSYKVNKTQLTASLLHLKERSGELEGKYRKVVSLCTGVDEIAVESMLGRLVEAVESERFREGFSGREGGVGGASSAEDGLGRVREFLRRVEER